MSAASPPPLSRQLVLSRDIDVAGERSEFYSRVRRGEFVCVVRGAYLAATEWSELDRREQQRLKSTAVNALSSTPLVCSHSSAAALWRLPRVGRWPVKEHAVENIGGPRSTSALSRHMVGIPRELERIDGLTVTTLARTVVDVAATHSFGEGVVAADAALRRTQHPQGEVPRTFLSRDSLLAEWQALPSRHGSARARRTLDFANGLADRPGESLSRVNMHLSHLTPPQLQATVYGASGRRYGGDFWWPEFTTIGEFDGAFKYSDPEFLNGRTPHQVLLDEKRREDDLRAAGYGFTRWDMSIALSPDKLSNHLRRAGIR